MGRYILRRLLLAIPVLIGVTLITFIIVRALPTDPIALRFAIAGQRATEEQKNVLRQQLNLDKPLPVQYLLWIGGVATLDFGKSIQNSRSVNADLAERLPVTIELAALAMLFSLLLAIPLGVIAAVRQDGPLDYVARIISIGGLSIPNFWLGTLALTLPVIWWRISFPTRYVTLWDNPAENLKMMWLPAMVLGFSISAIVMRVTRSTLLEVLRQDYVRTAWSKGLRERLVVTRHALKNALIPVVTIIGLQLSALLGGTVLIEFVFNIPGFGRWTLEAILQRDFPQIQAAVLITALVYVLTNLAVDVVYGYLDPRIRYS